MLQRTTISTLIVGLFLLMTTQRADAQGLGLSVGANFNSLSDIDTGSQEATFNNATGWHLHLWFDMPVGPVAVRPGLRYMDAGAVFEDEDLDIPSSEEVVSLLEIPVDVRIRMTMPLVTPYVLAGPVLRFPTGNENEDRFKSFSVAAGVGVGAEIGLGGLKVFPELKYTFGITRFTEDEYELGGIDFEVDDSQHLNAVMLSIGIGL